MRTLRFALFGAGFWSRYQLAGWREVPGAECVAIYNRTVSKARTLAAAFDVASVFDSPEALLDSVAVDFVDICTDVSTHAPLVALAAARKLPAICQKPMAPTLAEAEQMAGLCRNAAVPLYVNENWRWQAPIRRLREVVESGEIGETFRARIRMVSGFPVFANQPFLRELEQFLLADIGTHILDVARFLFGEARSVYCQTSRVQNGIRGEDVASVMLRMHSGATVICEMGYPGSPHEGDSFPQTYAFVEATEGSVSLNRDYVVRVTRRDRVTEERVNVPHYSWADPAYDVVHSSIVPCQRNLLAGLQGREQPETTADDNLRTLRLVYGAYESARTGQAVRCD